MKLTLLLFLASVAGTTQNRGRNGRNYRPNTFGFIPYSNFYALLNPSRAVAIGNQNQIQVPFAVVQEGVRNVWNFDASRIQRRSGFHRGQIESMLPQPGFTRGNIEARPFTASTFSRGAVEYSNSGNGNRIIRYEASEASAPQASEPSSKVICYFASWSYYRKGKGSFTPENVDPRLCTHLVYAFANLDKAKFQIKQSDPMLDKDKQFYARLISLRKRNPSLKVLLGLGGWSDSGDDKYSVLANSPARRKQFAVDAKRFVTEWGFDGLSLDWHYPKCWQSQCNLGPDSDKMAFSELVKELSSQFRPSGLILAATLSGYREVVDLAYDVPTLTSALDLMNVMSYDYHGSWESRAGHLAPLFMGPPSFDPYPAYNVNATTQYYLERGADKRKLVVGVPLYGQSFTLSNPGDSSYGSETTGPGIPGEYTQQPGMLAYYEICKRVKDQGWTTKYDRTGSWGPYAYKGDQWVGYDNPDFLSRKARYVKAQGLGGMFVWTLDLDDFNNECCSGSQPLLRTIAKELLGIEYEGVAGDCRPPVVPKPDVVNGTFGTSTVRPEEVSTEHTHQPTSTTLPPSSTWWPQTPPTTTTTPTTTFTANPTTQPSSSSTLPPTTPSPASNGTSVVFICTQVNGSLIQTSTESVSPSTPFSPQEGVVDVPENSCDNTWIYKPEPGDCTLYYRCKDGVVSQEKCPQGLHWNQYAHACDWPEYAKCSGGVTTSRPTTTTTTTTPWTTTTRPPTTTYRWTTRATTTTHRPPVLGCSTGDYSPGPRCEEYYVCVSGTQTLQRCGPGLHWNRDKMLCDWPQNANCQSQNSDPGAVGGESRPVRLPKSCNEGEYFGDEQDCEVYYVCNHGQPIMFRCQEGLYWNQGGKFCDWPANSGCNPSTSKPTTTTNPPIYTDPTTTTRKTTTTMVTTTTAKPPSTARPTTTTTEMAVTTMRPSASTTKRPTITTTTSPDIGGGGSKDYMIVCYFTNWAWYRPGIGKYKPENIDPNLCTHIVYGFAVLDYTELILKPHDSWADIDNKFYEQVTELKKRGIKVTLALGGWNDSQGDKYSRLVSSAASRKKFITAAIDFIKKYNFDGLDLDWEYPKCWQVECDKGPASDKPNFAAWVRELKEAFRPHGLLLSAAVSPSKMVIEQGYDVPTISKYLDWIAVMTYDFHGQWDKKTGHVAPLYFHEDDDFAYFNANYSINYWIKEGADRKKIVMGMPMYGQSFTLANPAEHGLNAPSTGGGTAGEFTRAAGFLAYYEICAHIEKDAWTVVQDPTGAMGPYAYKGNQWVSYDDVTMIRRKSQLIRDLDLGGGMIWALDLDDFRNTCKQGAYPLLTTIRNILRRPSGDDPDVEPEQIVEASTSEIVQVTTPKMTSTTTTTKRPTTTTTKPPKKVVATVETEDAFIIGEQDHRPTVQQLEEAVEVGVVHDESADCNAAPFKPSESDCNKYYMCIFGSYVEYSCPPETYWNKDHCDWTCGSEPLPGGSTTSPPLTPTTTTSPTTTQAPWSPSTTTQGSMTTTNPWWNPNPTPTTLKPPSTSTSWEWKPPIITTTTIHPIEIPPSDFMVVCYFTNWAWYRQGIGKYKPEDIDYNLCTHIAYGFAVLNPSTLEIRTHDGWADVDNSFYTQVTDLKSKGKKVVIAIGGWNDSLGDKYSKLVRDAVARRKFIQNVIAFIQKYNFDGLDLDWEYPKCWQTDCKLGPEADKENFATFVRELKEAFEPHGLLLSSAVSPSKTIIDEGYDVPTISKYLDWIAVMTYDYHGQWDKKTGHVAPMYNHEESDNAYFNSNYTINYWISKGAERKKIVMGMPMYGQSFTLANAKEHGLNAPSTGGGTAGEFTRAAGFLAYYEICSNIKKGGWSVVQDETGALGPYAYKGDQWVSFDDTAMIRRKSEYIKEMGLGGGMIWALDLDDFRNVCGCEKHPLLRTINRVLRNYPGPDPSCSI